MAEKKDSKKKIMHGTFANGEAFGQKWVLKIEDPGDIGKGTEVMVRRRDGEEKPVYVVKPLYKDRFKVLCTFDDPDSPQRPGKVEGFDDLDSADSLGDDSDPRPERNGSVAFEDGEPVDLGGVYIDSATFHRDSEAIDVLDLDLE